MGFTGVKTYIQSGNVIFESDQDNLPEMTSLIENQLSATFNYKSKVVMVSKEQLETVVKSAPDGFGQSPEEYRYDVMFLMPGFVPEDIMTSISPREGVDRMWSGERVVYFSRLIERAGSSYLNKIISTPIYKNITIRNWNTTRKLAGILEISD